jgi:hypothetical protein
MIAKNCEAAYQKGREDRLAYPLHSGMYKLIETRSCWAQSFPELRRIRLYLIGETFVRSFHHCTVDDFHQWARDAFLWRAFDVGYNIFPSIAALSADDVSGKTISRIDNALETSWPDLLNRLEATHRELINDKHIEADLVNLQKSRINQVLKQVDGWLCSGLVNLPWGLFDRVYRDHGDYTEEEHPLEQEDR